MEIENNDLEPLLDDLKNGLDLSSFLVSSSFKRGMVKIKIYDAYCEVYDEVKSDARWFYSDETSSRKKAFEILLDRAYSDNMKLFCYILANFLKSYQSWSKHEFYIGDILLDLKLLVDFDKYKIYFKGIGTMTRKKVKPDIELELSLEYIQELESKYIQLRDRDGDAKNRKDTISSYQNWFNSAVAFFSKFFKAEDSDYKNFKSVNNSGNGYTLSSNFNELGGVYSAMCSKIKNKENNHKMEQTQNNKIFIVHGHDEVMKGEVEKFLTKLELEPVILNEQASRGATVVEKLEQNSDVGFAIVLLSPCDEGRKKGTDKLLDRARQNVILELGYFMGRLGRKNVCTLKKNTVEEPSDVIGVVYTGFDVAGGWQMRVAKELKSAGYDIDVNKLV